jgi:ATP-dependent phosphoenolpyruvate carboxykinase
MLCGEPRDRQTEKLEGLNHNSPRVIGRIEPEVLNPRNTWHDTAAYRRVNCRGDPVLTSSVSTSTRVAAWLDLA